VMIKWSKDGRRVVTFDDGTEIVVGTVGIKEE